MILILGRNKLASSINNKWVLNLNKITYIEMQL